MHAGRGPDRVGEEMRPLRGYFRGRLLPPPARADDFPVLVEIERAAGQLFRPLGGNDGLIWPHRDAWIWPHPRPARMT